MKRALVYAALGVAVVVWGAVLLGVVLTIAAVATGTLKTYAIPSSAMEPTLHCGKPATGCEGGRNDRIVVLTRFAGPDRGDIVFFRTPAAAEARCGVGGTFVKRVVGLPGETVELRLVQGREYVYVDGVELDELYVEADRRAFGPEKTWTIPEGEYFLMGDNRSSSCDSRIFGPVPESAIIGEAVLTYWPPLRIGFR